MIAVFGGGEIAESGIAPLFDDVVVFDKAVCDVTDSDAVARLMVSANPECVVYTAGVSRPRSVAAVELGELRKELDTLFGAFVVAKHAARHRIPTMVFIASLAGLYGKPDHGGYCAAKAGLISLVQSLALEGHHAYAISPGRVNTAMRERDYPGEDPRTRLDPAVIGSIVKDILGGRYTPGDNIVVRMQGFDMLPIEIHRGDGWRERLKVGEPKTC